jgi:hypothetical protein
MTPVSKTGGWGFESLLSCQRAEIPPTRRTDDTAPGVKVADRDRAAASKSSLSFSTIRHVACFARFAGNPPKAGNRRGDVALALSSSTGVAEPMKGLRAWTVRATTAVPTRAAAGRFARGRLDWSSRNGS